MAINASIQNLINSNRANNDTDVKNLFYYFYGRTANANEINYWKNKTSSQLYNALLPNAKQFTNAGYYKDVLAKTPAQQQNQPPVAAKPAPASSPTAPPVNVAPAAKTEQKATLTSPDGAYKTVVVSGSNEASQLLGKGWKLGATGKSVIDVNQAITKINAPAAAAPPPATTPTELTGNAIPKEISGANGPVDAQGNPIASADYAKYGINDLKPAPAQTVVNNIIQPPKGQTPATGQPGASGASTADQYGDYIPSTDYLKLYNENEIMRDPSGRIYLKPGVPKRWNEPGTPTPGTTTPAGGTLVPSPDFLKYYNENEITRGADGKIYLKAGIPVRWTQGAGEVKTGENQANTAVDDLTNFDLGLQGVNLAEGTPEEDLMAKYQKAISTITQPQIEMQNKILETLMAQPSMVDELAKTKSEAGVEGVQKLINELNQAAVPLSKALQDLPDNLASRYADIGLSTAQTARRLALESKDLSETLANIAMEQGVLQQDLQMRQDAVKEIMNNKVLDRETKMDTLNTALSFVKENITQQKDLLDFQMELSMNEIERQQKLDEADLEYKRELEAEDRAFEKDVALQQLKETTFDDTNLRPLPASQTVMLSDGFQLPNTLDGLDAIINNSSQLFGPVAGRLGAANPYNTEAQTANAKLTTAAQLVGKYMEGGVLRQEDVAKYQRMLPQLTDTPEVAKQKLDSVRNMLQQKSLQYIDDFEAAGFDVSNFKGKLPGTEGIYNENTTLPPLTKSYSSLDVLTRENPAYIDLIEQLGQQYPTASDDDIMKLIEGGGGGFNQDLGMSQNYSKAIAQADGSSGGQCGRYVNKYTGLGVGDSYQSKMNKMAIKNPAPNQIKPGMVFTMPYKNTGHIGFIVSNNGDGTVTVKDSNWSLDEKVKTHKIAISKITGVTFA